jgi:hypothetical protein
MFTSVYVVLQIVFGRALTVRGERRGDRTAVDAA